jgi:hypothetical protein
LPSLTMIVRKFVMLASRAELSQHTLVHECAVAVFLDDLIIRPHIELRPQLVAECPLGERRDALGAVLRPQQLVGHRPLAEAPLVRHHLDPEHAAAGLAHCRKSDSVVHKGVLQIDYDERGPRGTRSVKECSIPRRWITRCTITSGIVAPFSFIGVPLIDQLGVGASGWSSFAFRSSAHSAGGIG